MPRYDLICEGCEHIWDWVCKIDERRSQTCPECGYTGSRVVHLEPVREQIRFPESFWDIGTDEVFISSRRQLREVMAKHNDNPDETKHSVATYDDGYASY